MTQNAPSRATEHPLLTAGRLCGRAILTLVALSVIFFAIAHMFPGGICSLYPTENVATCQSSLGFDSPAPVQFARWVGTYLHGDIGRSPSGREIAPQILGGVPETLLLILSALCVYLLLTTVGLLFRRRSWLMRVRWVTRAAANGALSLPMFWLGLLLVYILAVHWQILPPGRVDDPNISAFWSDPWFVAMAHTPGMLVINLLKHVILPSVTLATMLLLVDWGTGALAPDSLPEPRVTGSSPQVRGYRYRTALAARASVSSTPLFVATLITGVVVVEAVFSYTGLGNHFYFAVGSSPPDYAMALDLLMLASAVMVVSRLGAAIVGMRFSAGTSEPRSAPGAEPGMSPA